MACNLMMFVRPISLLERDNNMLPHKFRRAPSLKRDMKTVTPQFRAGNRRDRSENAFLQFGGRSTQTLNGEVELPISYGG
jgi:hypothetical protein